MLRLFKKNKISLSMAFVAVLYVSCANMGSGPQGGPYDFDAPVLLKSSPQHNATNFSGNKLELVFNENVVVKEPNQKVIVTPPQKRMPIVRSANKKVTVELRDTLKENTTYTIDFTDAIQDNNQENPLENFSISFSTGDVVDSLTISGKVIQAMDIEPVKGFYVGLHSNLEDSAFFKVPFERISRTNDKGEFTIRGVAPGKYHIFALDDKNRDYMYDNPMEAIAFYDVILEPFAEAATRVDTVFADDEKKLVDSIKTTNYTRFSPDNLVLKSFLSAERREYFRNADRVEQGRKIILNFGAATEKPKLDPLNFDSAIDWGISDHNISKDSIYTYWIKDESLVKMDTLLFAMTYNKTDSLNNLIPVTDSLRVVNRERKPKEKKKKDDEEEKITFLDIKSNAKGSWDIFDNIDIEFNEPLKDPLRSLISFQQKVDTIYKDVDFTFEVDSLNPRKYKISRRWKYGEEFKIKIDSAAVHSIYGLWNDKWEQSLKVKGEDQYGNLAITVSGINDSVPSFIELLDSSGKPLRKGRVLDRIALFRNVTPGKYFARLILDTNGNNKWDTGNYKEKIQPEKVYYYPEYFEIKAFWNHEESFNVDLESIDKPLEILKNKPQDKSAREKLLQEQDADKYEKEKQDQRDREDAQDPTGRAAMQRRR